MNTNIAVFTTSSLLINIMGSVCFKVEKDNSGTKPEKESAKLVLKSSQESRPLFKNKVLSVKKTFLVSATQNTKPKTEGCVRPFTQSEAQVTCGVPSKAGKDPVLVGRSEETSPKSGCSIPEESYDSWTQNCRPLRELTIMHGAVPVFKLDKVQPPQSLEVIPNLQHHKTACKTPTDSHVRTRADSFASACSSSKAVGLDISQVFEANAGDFTPKPMTRKESSKVAQVRRELMRLATCASTN